MRKNWVTVCIPSYNGAATIAQAIESVLEQTVRAHRLLVIDDGSHDATADIVKRYAREGVEWQANTTNVGLTGNWNRCVAQCTSPALAILHQDDRYQPTYLAELGEILEHDPTLAYVHCKATIIDEHGKPCFDGKQWVKQWMLRDLAGKGDPTAVYRRLLFGNFIICPTALYRTATLVKAGPFAGQYQFVPDWEYWLRLAKLGFSGYYHPRSLYEYRRHPKSATSGHVQRLTKYRERQVLLQSCADASQAVWNRNTDVFLYDLLQDLLHGRRAAAEFKLNEGVKLLRSVHGWRLALLKTAGIFFEQGGNPKQD